MIDKRSSCSLFQLNSTDHLYSFNLEYPHYANPADLKPGMEEPLYVHVPASDTPLYTAHTCYDLLVQPIFPTDNDDQQYPQQEFHVFKIVKILRQLPAETQFPKTVPRWAA